MVFSLFRSNEERGSARIAEAIENLSRDPSDKNRISLYRSLENGMLFVATQDTASTFVSSVVSSVASVSVPLLTTTAPGGGDALLAFTSVKEVGRRISGVRYFGMKSVEVMRLALGFSGLILNPAGPWAGVPREDLEKILKSIKSF